MGEPPKYWIAVIASDHAAFAVQNGVAAFAKGMRSSVEKLKEGDRFAFYSPKSGFNEGKVVQAFTALGRITGAMAYEKQWADTGFVAWVKDAEFEDISPVPVKPLLEDLSFVANPRYWGMAFRRGQFEISAKDFELIAQAMRS